MSKKKLAIKDLLNPDFSWAISQFMSLPLPARASYRAARIFKTIQEVEKDFNKVKKESLSKYAETKTANNGIEFVIDEKTRDLKWLSEESKSNYIKEINDVSSEKIEIDVLPFSFLGEDLVIEPRILILLSEIIDQSDVESSKFSERPGNGWIS